MGGVQLSQIPFQFKWGETKNQEMSRGVLEGLARYYVYLFNIGTKNTLDVWCGTGGNFKNHHGEGKFQKS